METAAEAVSQGVANSFPGVMQAQLAQIEPIFQAVAHCIQHPDDSPMVAPEGFRERQEWEEANEIMEEQRQEFLNLFKNTAKLSLDHTVKFVGEQLRKNLQLTSSFQVRQKCFHVQTLNCVDC